MPTARKSTKIDASIEPSSEAIVENAPLAPKAKSNTQTLIEMLTRDTGATIGQITDATGWLPHSARAALTGLRKKGHSIARTSADGTTTYRIVGRAQ